MDKLSILIADSSDDFRRALGLRLGDRYRVRCCADGGEALVLLRQLRPDLLVLDLMLPELDGLTLLQTAAREGLHPSILATSSLISPYIQQTAEVLGVDYLIRKPCSISSVAMRIEDMAEHSGDIRERTAIILHTLGFSARQNGTKCLPVAFSLYARNPSQALTKELYPAVGKLCDPMATGKKVEKDIRYAIKTAWEIRDPEVWQAYFPQNKRPSNGEFLWEIAKAVGIRRRGMEKE